MKVEHSKLKSHITKQLLTSISVDIRIYLPEKVIIHRGLFRVDKSLCLPKLKSIIEYYHMRDFDARTVRLRGDANFTMADTCMMPWPGQFNLHITSLFVVRNIKCWYSFS